MYPASNLLSANVTSAEEEEPEFKSDMKDDLHYFDKNVYLTVSGQLHLEAICNGVSRVYNFSPAFRAESGRSRRHLSEFWMAEAEVAFAYDLKKDIVDLIESFVKHIIQSVLESNSDDLETFTKLSQENNLSKHTTDLELLEVVANLSRPYVIMTYREAMQVLLDKESEFRSKPKYGEGLGSEHEIFLVEKYSNNVPVFIIDWPASTKPFYSRLKDDSPWPNVHEESLVSAVDLLFPKVGELCGGALREHRYDVLKKRTEELDKTNKLMETLKWYLNLRRIGGASPMGGFGLGFDRLIQFILGINNIKDTLPFPRTPHNCRL